MSITIDLSPEIQSLLEEEAKQQGLSLSEFAEKVLEERATKTAVPQKRISARGFLAHLPGSSEDFMREKHEENEREEARWEA